MLQKLLRLLGWRPAGRGSGAEAERWAADWLRQQAGFAIVARNWRNPNDRRDEIDLVCHDGEVLVFVEVKARAAAALVPGYYAVTPHKKRIVLRAAKAYLARLNPRPVTFRFDIVAIALPAEPGAAPEIRHYANVPLFPKDYRW